MLLHLFHPSSSSFTAQHFPYLHPSSNLALVEEHFLAGDRQVLTLGTLLLPAHLTGSIYTEQRMKEPRGSELRRRLRKSCQIKPRIQLAQQFVLVVSRCFQKFQKQSLKATTLPNGLFQQPVWEEVPIMYVMFHEAIRTNSG